MLFHCLFVLFLGVWTASARIVVPDDDFNRTYIVFDVSANKGSSGSLNTAFNNLKNPDYAVKIVGEERAIFVVQDDDDCNTLQSDFHGLQVKAIPVRARPDDVVFNDTRLVVVVIQSTLDGPAIRQALDNALAKCDNCFKVFATFGRKPQKCILIGNIPFEQITDIVDSTTADKCCDSAYTRRAMIFNTFQKSSCFDVNSKVSVHKPINSPRITPKPVHPIHKRIQSVHPFSKSKPINPVHPFPDNVKHEAKGDKKIPVAPHKSFPIHEIKPPKIEHPRFSDIKFPSLKADTGYGFDFDTHGKDFDPHGKSEQRTYF